MYNVQLPEPSLSDIDNTRRNASEVWLTNQRARQWPLLRAIVVSSPLLVLLSLLASMSVRALEYLTANGIDESIRLLLALLVALATTRSTLWRHTYDGPPVPRNHIYSRAFR